MKEAIWFLILMALWFALNIYIFPKLGIRTWLSQSCPVEQSIDKDQKSDINDSNKLWTQWKLYTPAIESV